LGEAGSPDLLSTYFQYRGEPSITRPAHLELGFPSTYVNLFSNLDTGNFFGDIIKEVVGPGISPLMLDESYTSTAISLAKQFSHHAIKFGWDLQRARVDGTESKNIFDVLFATVDARLCPAGAFAIGGFDFATYGLENSGVHVTFTQE
jgi:hypothetical protein